MKRKNTPALMNRRAGSALFFAVGLFVVYQFFPQLSEIIAWSVMMVIPVMWIFIVIPWLVAGALCVAISIVFWLAGVQRHVLVSFIGFSASYIVVSLLSTLLELPILIEILIGAIMALGLFIVAMKATSTLTLNRSASVITGSVLLGLSLFLAPMMTQPIGVQRIQAKTDNEFKTAVDTLSFTPYYPTYASSVFSLGVAKINGYRDSPYVNETVTYLLGKAHVKQSGYLKDQDKIVNLTDNCTLYRLWSAMDNGSSIPRRDIDKATYDPRKCNLIAKTPTGKKIYFSDQGRRTLFYVMLDRTNFMIEFDGDNNRKYDPAWKDEMIKIIDSLQPLDKAKIENGRSFGGGFSY